MVQEKLEDENKTKFTCLKFIQSTSHYYCSFPEKIPQRNGENSNHVGHNCRCSADNCLIASIISTMLPNIINIQLHPYHGDDNYRYLQTVTAAPSLTPLLQKSPKFSSTQVLVISIRFPAVSSKFASASSKWMFKSNCLRFCFD